MTTIVMTYTVNPLKKIWNNMIEFFEEVGYARAAAELARQGYHNEAKQLMLYRKEMKASR